jgi:hypothetical protein
MSIYLHKEDLLAIIDFMDAFNPDHETVQIDVDSSSGIGSVVTATLNGLDINGKRVSVSQVISDEGNW